MSLKLKLFVLLCGAASIAMIMPVPACSDVFRLQGTFGEINVNTIDLPIMEGDAVTVTMTYDETQMESAATQDDPTSGVFIDPILSARIEIPAAGLDIAFTPVDVAKVQLSGVSVIDSIIWNADGSLPAGDPVESFALLITQIIVVPPGPTLVTDVSTLPSPDLELDKPGVTVGLDMYALNFATFSAPAEDEPESPNELCSVLFHRLLLPLDVSRCLTDRRSAAGDALHPAPERLDARHASNILARQRIFRSAAAHGWAGLVRDSRTGQPSSMLDFMPAL